MATYYIDPSGNDSTGTGAIGSPWRNLARACQTATNTDIIHVNAGTYTIASQVSLPRGVSIEGVGDTSLFSCSVNGGSIWAPTQFALLLPNATNTNGQHISNVKFDGNKTSNSTFSGGGAIYVNRSNVTINNCSFTNFAKWGVWFMCGSEPPSFYITGAVFHDNYLNDCAGYWNNGGTYQGTNDGNSSSLGCLGLGGTDGALVYNNTMIMPGTRSSVTNEGECIYGVEGFVKNTKIYNNTLRKVLRTGGTWDFAIEIWNWEEGNEIYNNTLEGSIDVVMAVTNGQPYSVWIHDNIIGQPQLQQRQSCRGVLLESFNAGVIIERNYIHHVGQGVFCQNQNVGTHVDDITIRYNIFDQIGCATGTSAGNGGWAVLTSEENGGIIYNRWNVYNNVCIGATGGVPTRYGMSVPDGGTANTVNIKNNIIYGFNDYAIRANNWGYLPGTVINGLSITNNIFYANSTNGIYFASGVSTPGYSASATNVVANPPFVSLGAGNYHLTAARPGVFITTGLTDKDGNTVLNPPTIGAYEFGGTPVQTLPTVSTTAVTAITNTTATSGGNVSSDGNSPVTARGVVWGTAANPTIVLTTKTSNGTGTGSFTSSITGLTLATTYYVRAYATNAIGTNYGSNIIFVTTGGVTLPTVTTTTITSITSTTASSGGNVTSEGGGTVTERGIVWATTANPTVTTYLGKNINGQGAGTFLGSLSNLTAGTTYHVRAYATNSAGTAYGADQAFVTTTTSSLPTVGPTTPITGLTSTTANTGGNILTDGGSPITMKGIVLSRTNPLPDVNLNYVEAILPNAVGVFVVNFVGLTPGTFYYIRAFASNANGTAYANTISFTTPSGALVPTVTTAAISSITATTASGGGNVTADGGATVTVRGICWSTTTAPTTANSLTSNGTGTGAFTSSITGLSGGVTYYVRAYATNSVGTAYGNEVSFAALAVVPTVVINSVSSITSNTANIAATVTATGGATVTARGICYATTPNPTTANLTKPNGSGTGAYTTTLTSLASNTTYYVRAYAINSTGTAYSAQTNFTTDVGALGITISNRIHHYQILGNYSPMRVVSQGDGTGVGYLRLNTSIDQVLTLDGVAKFYTDSAGTTGESSTWLVQAGGSRLTYIRCSSGTSNLYMNNELVTAFGDVVSMTGGNPCWGYASDSINSPLLTADSWDFPNCVNICQNLGQKVNIPVSVLSFSPTLQKLIWYEYYNMVNGTTADVPSTCTIFSLFGSLNNIIGNVANFPAGLLASQIASGCNITGDIADLPRTMTDFFFGADNTLYGDIANLPTTIKTFYLGGNNTVSGDIDNIPNGATQASFFGNNTVTGSIANVPSTLTTLQAWGYNTISGNISTIQSALHSINVTGYNTITGDLSGLAGKTIYTLYIYGYNTISGNISNLPSMVSTFECAGNNTVTGNLSGLATTNLFSFIVVGENTISGNLNSVSGLSNLQQFRVEGSNTLTGNLSDLPANIYYLHIRSADNTINGYTTKTWTPPNGLNLYLWSMNAGNGLSSAEVDQLLIDLGNYSWPSIYNRTIIIQGTGHAARTAASDAAVAHMISAHSVSIITN